MTIEVRAPTHIRAASVKSADWYDGQWTVAEGCTKISPGCANCSAAALSVGTPFADEHGWTGRVEPVERQITVTPKCWPGPLKLLVCSTSDFWHSRLSDEFRLRVWNVVKSLPQHTFAFLTKRSANMAAWFADIGYDIPDNVWLGVTVETDDYRWRLDHLLTIPAKVRYAQCEPLLDRVHLRRYLEGSNGLDWVIAGPEFGCPNPRPCQPAWMRQLRDDCAEFDVPFFTKHLIDGCEHRQLP